MKAIIIKKEDKVKNKPKKPPNIFRSIKENTIEDVKV